MLKETEGARGKHNVVGVQGGEGSTREEGKGGSGWKQDSTERACVGRRERFSKLQEST